MINFIGIFYYITDKILKFWRHGNNMKGQRLISPLFIIPILFSLVFLVWIIFFPQFKNEVPGLATVPFYLSASSLFKYVVLFCVFYFFILFGSSFQWYVTNNKNLEYNNEKGKLRYSTFKNKSFINYLFFVLFVIVFLLEMYSLIVMFQNYNLSTLVSKGFQQVAYITLQDEENIWRTFYNLLPIVSAFYFRGFFLEQRNKKNKIITFLIFLISIRLFFSAARQITLIIWLIFFLYFVKYKIQNKISVMKLLLILLLLFFLIIFSELFRFGVWNSSTKNISLFSIANINDVTKYIMVAYIGKNVNNAMIFLDSKPTYSMNYAGSGLFDPIINFLGPKDFIPIHDIGPHGTVDFIGLLWVGWGWFSIIVLALLGFLIGFAYKRFILFNTLRSDLLYAIIFPGIISIIRINYFFLNLFIYSFILYIIIDFLLDIK